MKCISDRVFGPSNVWVSMRFVGLSTRAYRLCLLFQLAARPAGDKSHGRRDNAHVHVLPVSLGVEKTRFGDKFQPKCMAS
jgi:hypothetical protein